MIEGFLNPALAAGAALAAVPLIIHLLNRQRYRPMPWAAMRFVLAAHRRTRRRVQLENLLLLLLRMGAVALLALAVARPFLSGATGLGLLTEDRRDLIVILDGSASTGLREGASSVFDRLRERALELAEDLDGEAGDRLHVILAGRTPRLVSWPSPEKASLVLPTLTEPLDEAADLGAALAEALGIVGEGTESVDGGPTEIVILTDLQRSAFLSAEGALNAGLQENLTTLEERGVRVTLEDGRAGSIPPANTAVQDLGLASEVVRALEPTEIVVGLELLEAVQGGASRVGVRVTVEVDGNPLPSKRVDLRAGSRVEARFPHTFQESGSHTLRASIDGDDLAIDDTRAAVVVVPRPARVLVVNGSPSSRLEEDEAGFLVLALQAPEADGRPSDFTVEEVSAASLASGEVDLSGREVIWLADVAALPESVASDLEARVAEGVSLVISCGESLADASALNARLFRPDGSGLLPGELRGRVRSPRRESYFRVREFDGEHPALSFFDNEQHRPLLAEVPIEQFVRVAPLGDARILASLDDDGRSPLLIERPYLDGRVWLWTTSIGRAWTPLPQLAPAMIPLVVEWVRHAGRRDPRSRETQAGVPPLLESEAFPRELVLVGPSGARSPLAGEPLPAPRGRYLLPPIDPANLGKLGLYEIEVAGSDPIPFAVTLATAESNLARVSAGELESLHSGWRVLTGEEDGSEIAAGSPLAGDGELWRPLAWLCLAFLVGESLWGARLGRRGRRSIA